MSIRARPPITGFMAATTKIAAFGALMRVLYVAVPVLAEDWRPALWVVAILTMALGTIAAISQKDVKRMLAYSAVAHTGFILTGVIAGNPRGVGHAVLPGGLRVQHGGRLRRRRRGA